MPGLSSSKTTTEYRTRRTAPQPHPTALGFQSVKTRNLIRAKKKFRPVRTYHQMGKAPCRNCPSILTGRLAPSFQNRSSKTRVALRVFILNPIECKPRLEPPGTYLSPYHRKREFDQRVFQNVICAASEYRCRSLSLLSQRKLRAVFSF